MMQDIDLVKIAVAFVGAIMPLLILIVRLHNKNVERLHELRIKTANNGEQLVTIRQQLDHQDDCIDDLKRDALVAARGGVDFVRRNDIEAELTRIRQAISAEITRTIDNFDARLRALELRK